MQWDDLRYVLAVNRAGSMAGAARLLKTSHVTVFRRIEALEKDLGVRLFDRKRQGYVPTAAARELLPQAEAIEEQVNALERRVWREDSQVRGTVRLTATEPISLGVLPDMLARLGQAEPGLLVDLDASEQSLNIAKRDADIAIRYTGAPPEMLVGHELAPVAYAVYGTRRLATRYRRHGDLAGLPWLAPGDLPGDRRFHDWMREHGLERQVRMRCGSWISMAEAARAGAGVAVVSCYVADYVGGLTALTPPLHELKYQYWILTHPELRQVARVAAVYGFLRTEFARLRPWFLGKGPRG